MIPHSRKESSLQRELDRLESAIKALKVEYDKFFNGAVPVPPEDFRDRVERRFRLVRSRPTRAFAERFRLNTLEARFNVLCELFNRRLRDLERAAQRRPPAQARPERLNPQKGITLDGTTDREAVEALYRGLYRSSGRATKIDFDSFQQYLDSQIDRLRAKAGCTSVQFRVTGEGDQTKLKARPVPAAGKNEGVSS